MPWQALLQEDVYKRQGLRLGITRQQVANSFRTATNGLPLGEYREGDVSLPILLKRCV